MFHFQTEPNPRKDRNQQFNTLAERCKMGDTQAMAAMAAWFREGFSKEETSLCNAYEKAPNPRNLKKIEQFINSVPEERNFALKAYMMWIVRAALYGDPACAQLLERCSCYNEGAALPRYMFVPGKTERINIWKSETLYRLGFTDCDFEVEDCSLYSLTNQGYFPFLYLSYYEPPDEDGFGMETEYEAYYFDEFFCRIPVEEESELPAAAAQLKSQREYYWEAPKRQGKKFHHYLINT